MQNMANLVENATNVWQNGHWLGCHLCAIITSLLHIRLIGQHSCNLPFTVTIQVKCDLQMGQLS